MQLNSVTSHPVRHRAGNVDLDGRELEGSERAVHADEKLEGGERKRGGRVHDPGSLKVPAAGSVEAAVAAQSLFRVGRPAQTPDAH